MAKYGLDGQAQIAALHALDRLGTVDGGYAAR